MVRQPFIDRAGETGPLFNFGVMLRGSVREKRQDEHGIRDAGDRRLRGTMSTAEGAQIGDHYKRDQSLR